VAGGGNAASHRAFPAVTRLLRPGWPLPRAAPKHPRTLEPSNPRTLEPSNPVPITCPQEGDFGRGSVRLEQRIASCRRTTFCSRGYCPPRIASTKRGTPVYFSARRSSSNGHAVEVGRLLLERGSDRMRVEGVEVERKSSGCLASTPSGSHAAGRKGTSASRTALRTTGPPGYRCVPAVSGSVSRHRPASESSMAKVVVRGRRARPPARSPPVRQRRACGTCCVCASPPSWG
jgi:hypothetical protein